MAYTTINNPADYFNTVLYTGTGTFPESISGVGFSPEFIWIKRRNATASHVLSDIIRGTTKTLYTDSTSAELTNNTYGWVSSFDSDGFSVNQSGSSGENVNASGSTYASWNWLAGGTAVSNTDGALASTVSANQTSGFSIVKVTAVSSGVTTIGHGLGVAPKMIIKKTTSTTSNWPVYHASVGASQVGELNLTNAFSGSGQWGSTAPTSTVFSNDVNSGQTEIFYCFADVKGYSKFGSYIGNGSTDGTFVYTGFLPAWVLYKKSSAGENWHIVDNKRDTLNPNSVGIDPNNTNAEADDANIQMDFLSNGFKLRTSHGTANGSGATYIYMAFAENPLVNSGFVPNNAR